jgi:hypothetical protein
MRHVLATAVAFVTLLVGAAALAQPPAQIDEVRRLLNAIEVDANAINDAPDSQPYDSLVRLANEIDDAVKKLPALVVDVPPAQRTLVQLSEAVGRLVADTYNQDRFTAASDARDILDGVTRLRTTLGIPR